MPQRPLRRKSSSGGRGQRQNLVTSYGLLWRADGVGWKDKALLGRQARRTGGRPTNFWTQSGLYGLYDGDHIHYIGIAGKLALRLNQHRKDRHAGRWDRFSWFGFNELTQDRDRDRYLIPNTTFQRKGREVKSGRQDATVRAWRVGPTWKPWRHAYLRRQECVASRTSEAPHLSTTRS
jgi:hypothetical protein